MESWAGRLVDEGESAMTTYRPRREFLKRLLALPLAAAAPRAATAAVRDYDLYLFPVAGFRFHDGPALLERIRVGMPLALVPEPDNPHDRRAIRIEAYGHHLGYVPRSDNRPLFRLLRQAAPLEARVIGVQREGESWDALRVAVRLSALGSDPIKLLK
jgi:hypothetical protein